MHNQQKKYSALQSRGLVIFFIAVGFVFPLVSWLGASYSQVEFRQELYLQLQSLVQLTEKHFKQHGISASEDIQQWMQGSFSLDGVDNVLLADEDGSVIVPAGSGKPASLPELPLKHDGLRKLEFWFQLDISDQRYFLRVTLSKSFIDDHFFDLLMTELVRNLFFITLLSLPMFWFLKGLSREVAGLRQIVLSDNENPEVVSYTLNETRLLAETLGQFVSSSVERKSLVSGGFEEITRLISVFEYAPLILVTLDLDGNVIYANKNYKEIQNSAGLKGDNSYLMPEGFEKMAEQAFLMNRSNIGNETVCNSRNYLWYFMPVVSEGVVHCYGVDITEIRTAEKEAEKAYLRNAEISEESQAKSRFITSVSHEIRTPLTAVLGFAESVLDTGMPMQERVDAIKTIIENAKNLQAIIDEILLVNQLESSSFSIRTEEIDLENFLHYLEAEARVMAERKSLSFRFEVTLPLPEKIYTDNGRLNTVLMNLVSNAVKFTESGMVKLGVVYEKSVLRFFVADSGVGIDSTEVNSVFERFNRSRYGHDSHYAGIGLGLYIARELIRKMGGDISVQSQPGKGSRFDVELPLPDDENCRLIEAYELGVGGIVQVEAEERRFTGNVLVVEDSVDNQRLFTLYLNGMGLDVLLAANGKKALEVYEREKVDLVIMDIQMPVMDGVEATRRLRLKGYVGPIVVLTANMRDEEVARCFDAGCDEVLTKPVRRQEFVRQIGYFVNSKPQDKVEQGAVVSALAAESEGLASIVAAYVSQLPADLQEMRNAQQEKQYAQLRQLAHKMKGTSGNLGYFELSELCTQLEFSVVKADEADIADSVDQIENMIRRIEAGVATS